MNITKEQWEKILSIVLAAVLAIFAVLGWVINPAPTPATEQPPVVIAPQALSERINLDSLGDNQISNGGDLIFWSGFHTGEKARIAGDSGAVSAVYLTSTNVISMAGATFTGPIKYGTATSYTSGDRIAHGFVTTPTMCMIWPSPVTATVTITATGFTSDIATTANPVMWLCGK